MTRAEACLHTKWHLDPSSRLATIDIAENWGCVPLGTGAGSPSNTMWPGPRLNRTPSFILIRRTAWPQYINATDRQTDRHNNGPIAYANRFTNGCPKSQQIIISSICKVNFDSNTVLLDCNSVLQTQTVQC